MCGITGYCDYKGIITSDHLRSMTEALSHRGPDDSGIAEFTIGKCRIGLGHRRLAIIDLTEAGHQPMYCHKAGSCIVYNGELYNYREIKRTLQDKGWQFFSRSDTEVIMKAFAEHGTDCVQSFIGMFAFALLDQKRESIYLFRDRAGVKPLYYFWDGQLLMFASELKAFHTVPNFRPEIDLESLSLYLKYKFIPAPSSIFKLTYKLMPGHFVKLDLAKRDLSVKQYWNSMTAYSSPKRILKREDIISEVESILISAFKYRLVSDVPVGVFLSSGYDSTTLSALLASQVNENIQTFTIGFTSGKFDEAPAAREIAEYLGTRHTQVYCEKNDALAIVPELPTIFDEPLGDASAVPTTLVSRITREHVKVALAADGGDEIFGGYEKYLKGRADTLISLLGWLGTGGRAAASRIAKTLDTHLNCSSRLGYLLRDAKFATKFESAIKMMQSGDKVRMVRYKIEPRYFCERELRELIGSNLEIPHTAYDEYDNLVENMDGLDSCLLTDYRTFLAEDVLHKVDRATMSVGLEGREPFLDHRILEYVAKLPTEFKCDGDTTKVLLREIVHKYVPNKIMRGSKKGFEVPLEHWLRYEIRDLVRDHLNVRSVRESGILNYKIIDSIVSDFYRDLPVDPYKIWILFVFQMWAARWRAY